MKRAFNSKKVRSNGPYATMIAAGDFLYLSGQLPIDYVTNEVVNDNIRNATRKVLENIRSLLKEVQLEMSDIVKINLYLTDIEDMEEVDQVYKSFFSGDYPARTGVVVSALPQKAKIQMDAVVLFKG